MNAARSGLVAGLCMLVVACGTSPEQSATSTSTPAAEPTTSSSTSAPATDLPKLFSQPGVIAPGTYLVDQFDTPVKVTFTEGWAVGGTHGVHGPGEATFIAFFDVTAVFSDSCQWIDTEVTIGPTVDDFINALGAQKNTETTDPKPVQVSGFKGTEIALSSPAGLDRKTCYGGQRLTWTNGGTNETNEQVTTVWALDVDGQRCVITFGSFRPLSEAQQRELDTVVGSITIG